jgi:tetratricopeptide (TPR) repeat protein
MASDINAYRIFIASPRGLDAERKCFHDLIADYNRTEAIHRGIHFVPVAWEDTLETKGRPQELINKDLQACDYFVFLLWDRWGSKPTRWRGRFTAGIEEEFNIAKDALADPRLPMKQMVLLFKGIDPRRISDPGIQLRRVLKFREKIEKDKEFIYHHLDTLIELERCLRMFLAKWTRDHEQRRAGASSLPAPETTKAAEESPTRREIGLARRVVLTGDAEAVLNYSLFLMKTGRLSRARTVLEGVLARSGAIVGAGKRQEVEAAFDDLSQEPDHGSLASDSKSELYSKGKFYVHRYLAAIDEPRAHTLDPDAGSEELGDRDDTADDRAIRSLISELREIGQGFQRSGLLALAQEVHRRCLALADSINSNISRVQSFTDLAIVYSLQRDYRTAEQFARRAVAACPGSREGMRTVASSNLGLILLENDRAAEGRELLESAGPFWRERIRIDALSRESSQDYAGFVVVTKDDPTAWRSQDYLAAAYGGLGLFHLYMGDPALAEKHHIEAHLTVGLYSAISPALLNNLGVISHTIGNLSAAIEYFQQALNAGPRGVDGLNPVQGSFIARAQVIHNWSIIVSGTPQCDAAQSAVAQALLDLGSRLATVRGTDEPWL